jgi:predicted TIM-barrel fold metal-dependent hydrolase
MPPEAEAIQAPEYNVTGLDFNDRRHFRYAGPPLIDIHAHVTLTRPTHPPELAGTGEGSLAPAATMLEVAAEFGITRTYSMCPPEDVLPLRERFGDRLGFNGLISKGSRDESDVAVYGRLEEYLAAGVEILKFWSAPRGRERGLFVDAPWRIEALRRARAAGLRVVMVHVADPDTWFRTMYADPERFGTKGEQYHGLCRMLELFPEVIWIAAHMGGDVEHPDHLEELLERYPHLHLDTSATKWQVREASARREAVRDLICRRPERFLFGSDLVTRHGLPRDHYASRYWCQRTLWESDWEGPSPIADPDYLPEGEQRTPTLRGLHLPEGVLRRVYHDNAARLLSLRPAQ